MASLPPPFGHTIAISLIQVLTLITRLRRTNTFVVFIYSISVQKVLIVGFSFREALTEAE